MHLMRKLLDNLGDMWNKLPKEVPLLTIGQGTGVHTMVSVDTGVLCFHSAPFRSELPQKQTIVLNSMTTQELLDTIQSMGYTANLTSEALEKGLDVHKPFILMEVSDIPLTGTLTAFTSNLWRTMYPVYRVLKEAQFDTEQALKQLNRQLADGEWLDFWASFFSIQREPGEDDNNFVRRFTMWLFNPKTNNIALKELLSYRLKDSNIDVHDKAPLQFELLVGTKYITDASALHKILREAKGAGIQYFLNYQDPAYTEDYRQYLADAMGAPFEHLDTLMPMQYVKTLSEAFAQPSEDWVSTMYSKLFTEDPYVLTQNNIDTAFTLEDSELDDPTPGVSELFTSAGLTTPQDIAVITLTQGGVTIVSQTEV